MSGYLMLSDYGVDKYDIGTAFGHFGIAVEDVSSLIEVSPSVAICFFFYIP